MAVKRMIEVVFLAVLVGAIGFVSGRGSPKKISLMAENRLTQLKNALLDDTGDLLQWKGIGCYKDKPDKRALEISLGKSGFSTPQDIIKSCAKKAVAKGYVYFGIQEGLECWASKEGHLRYDKFGKADNCRNGLGRHLSNYVYEITKVKGYCVAHFQLYKYNTLTSSQPCETCICHSTGHVFCHHKTCKPLPLNCERSVVRQGECCPVCECYHKGTHYKDGDAWWWPISERGCEECTCSNSKAVCKIKVCPICKSYVNQPGQCCRACATQAPITFTIKPTTELVMALPTPPWPFP